MVLIRPRTVEEAAQQTAAYNHPHFESAAGSDFHSIVWKFKPFTGMEEEPAQPPESWRDDGFSEVARQWLTAQYHEARILWGQARYVRDLKAAAEGAGAVWADSLRARARAEDLFAALGRTADSHWRSAVMNLVVAQNGARRAAERWDERAAQIAAVHGRYVFCDLSRGEAYEQADVIAAGWVIGCACDYQPRPGRDTPLVMKVAEVINAQRDHLQQAAALVGDSASV
ncbi:hypothetical protein [Streptomyces chartreusis]|uniref:hypothetical protein n=1 Tax=Streptomyces chartreusis TaxID=1969 RepID=UPI0037AA4DC0